MAVTPEQARAELARRRGEQQPAAPSPQASSSVTPEQARAELARRRGQRPAPTRQPDVGEDVGRSLVTGAQEGVAFLAGLPRDAQDLLGRGLDAAAARAMRAMGRSAEDVTEAQRRVDEFRRQRPINLPGGETFMNWIESFAGPRHTPQTTAGEYARTVGQFATGAAAPGGLLTRAARAVVPGVASEAAGQVTEGTPLEVPARIAGGLAGGIATEVGAATAAQRAASRAPRPNSRSLEDEFGPLTAGERSGNARARQTEDDWRRGFNSEQAQDIMTGFDNRRAPEIRDNIMRIATRGQEGLSEDAASAGTILSDTLRTQLDDMRATQDRLYRDAFDKAQAENVSSNETGNALLDAVDNAISADFLDAGQARAIVGRLQAEITQGRATYATVERARQALNRLRTSALKSNNDADLYAITRIIDEVDAFVAPRLSADASRALTEVRGFTREMLDTFGRRQRTDLATGHVGRSDPGGGAIERVLNTDLTGEQVIDAILGAGTKPSAQTLGAVRRIRENATQTIQYTNRDAVSGIRVPGRGKKGGQTAGERRFAADSDDARMGVELPKDELQALREGFFHRMLTPLDNRNEGALIPAQTTVTNLRTALDGPGKEITELMFTPREVAAMRRALAYMERLVPPPGTAVSGTPIALSRMIASAFDNLLAIIPGAGPVLRETISNAAATGQARRAIAAPSSQAPKPPRPPASVETQGARSTLYGAEGAASSSAQQR